MGVIAWWAGLDWKLRIGIGLLFLGISTAALFAGRIWIPGWVLGTAAILVGGKTDQEKKGYRNY